MMFSTSMTERRSPPPQWMLEKYDNERRLLNQALFDSRAGIVCSRTARCLQLSTLVILVNCFVEIARASLFAENLTGMEALTTMCLSTTNAYGISMELVGGMYRECIRIFSEYEGLHGALMPTLQSTRMLSETLSPTEIDQHLQREVLMLTEWANDAGRQSQMLQTKTAFLRSARKWIRELWSQLSATYPDTQTGNILIYEDPTTPPEESLLTWEDTQNSRSTSGHGSTRRVGESCTSGTSTHGPSLREATPRARAIEPALGCAQFPERD